jgi:transcriptional regulator with XRE-family HTH domain
LVEKWTGRLIGKMHNERIKFEDVASELDMSVGYLSMILNGKRNPPGAKDRLEQAVNAIVERRRQQGGNPK